MASHLYCLSLLKGHCQISVLIVQHNLLKWYSLPFYWNKTLLRGSRVYSIGIYFFFFSQMHCHLNREEKKRANFFLRNKVHCIHSQLYLHIGGSGICLCALSLAYKSCRLISADSIILISTMYKGQIFLNRRINVEKFWKGTQYIQKKASLQ